MKKLTKISPLVWISVTLVLFMTAWTLFFISQSQIEKFIKVNLLVGKDNNQKVYLSSNQSYKFQNLKFETITIKINNKTYFGTIKDIKNESRPEDEKQVWTASVQIYKLDLIPKTLIKDAKIIYEKESLWDSLWTT